jgi:hypothetical protein
MLLSACKWMAVQEDSFLSDIHKDSTGSLSHEVILWIQIIMKLLSARLSRVLMWLAHCVVITFQGTLISQFVFNIHGLKNCSAIAAAYGSIPQFDEDGDLVLPRSLEHHCDHESNATVTLHIGINYWDALSLSTSLSLICCFVLSYHSTEHALSTPLSGVGQQVWRGALVMSDYILHNRELFKDSTVLELGAGVGVVSIVASLIGAKCVLCTGLYKTHWHVSIHTLQCIMS